MASVAICPHCYLQLIVPDGVERDEPVECPTCAKEFELGQAVLRAIPEIVRKQVVVETAVVSPAVEAAAAKAAVPEINVIAEAASSVEVVLSDMDAKPELDDRMPTADHEINKLVEAAAKSGAEQETEFVEQVKARIEAELAAGGLKPGTTASIPLESIGSKVSDDLAESVETTKDDFASWFRDTKTTMELPADAESVEDASVDNPKDDIAAEDVPSELALDAGADAELSTPLSDDFPDEQLPETDELAEVVAEIEDVAEVVEVAEKFSIEMDLVDNIVDELEISGDESGVVESDIAGAPGIEEVVARIDAPASLPETFEPRFSRASATTLADLLPRDPADEAPGPSFELPNVPLVPSAIPANNGATAEFDSISSLGVAAETEFELEDVNFDAAPAEVDSTDDAEYSEVIQVAAIADDDEPVFREPIAGVAPAAPFVIPGVPRPRKKRSMVRTLMGVGLGGMFGVAAALFILLWALGRDGDLFNVAQYLPDELLPASLKSSQPQVALSPPTSPPATEPSSDEPSTNQQASYVEETPTTSAAATEAPLTDDRYASEPSPLDEPTAEPIATESAVSKPTTSTAPEQLPFQGPTFTVEQLAAALQVAKEAEAGLVTGDLSDAAVRRMKGMSYSKLCDLANALTFVEFPAPSVESEQAVAGTEQLFGTILADSHTRSEVARIASVWINSPHRRHGGIFVAGAVKGGENAGDVYEYRFTSSDGSPLTTTDEQPVTVIMAEPLDPLLGSSAELGIIGHILDHPRDDVVGYTGSAERAIWVTRAIPLE